MTSRSRWVPVAIAVAAISLLAIGGALVAGRSGGQPPRSDAAIVGPSQPAPATISPAAPSANASSSAAASSSPTPRAAGAVPGGGTGKKGVCVWKFNGVSQALAQSGARWYYTWSTTHSGITNPPGVGFVPMIWGAKSVTAAALAEARGAGPYLLGFNEPDMAAQSNMTVDQALSLWPQLMGTGLTLGSPAVATGGATPGGWLDRFMSGAAGRGYRVDFITLHWYGSDFVTTNAVRQLRSYLQAVYDRYHKPIWLTEYALIKFAASGSTYPSQDQQAAFVTASGTMLSGLPFLARYAWFALPAAESGDSTGLYRGGPVATTVGRAFQAVR